MQNMQLIGAIDRPEPKVEVEARWTTEASGTGYYVVVSTAEPEKHDYATCRSGTSCLVPTKVPLVPEQTMSWPVTVKTTRGDKVASAFRVCLIGRA